jgi:putative glutamine amidotransferase
MLRSLAIAVVLFSFISHGTTAQDTLLLFHPTKYNIQVIEGLVEEGILSLEGIHVLGVYHEKEQYDYHQAIEYIEQEQAEDFTLKAIAGPLVPGDLFSVNTCTRQFRKLFDISSGAFFMGGPDIPPRVYREPVNLLTRVTDPFRHYVEASFLFHLLGGSQQPGWKPYLESRPGYLISGICLGMQTMNVATGGTLVQDIPSELYGIWNAEDILASDADKVHRNYSDLVDTGCEEPTSYHFHRVKLQEESFFCSKAGFPADSDPLVLSSHHQAIENMGSGWVVAAVSMDGKIIEAIEHEKYAHVFGVQFHPEKPGLYDSTIVHTRDCSNTINFQDKIRNTDSYKFHVAYWKYVGDALQKSRSE